MIEKPMENPEYISSNDHISLSIQLSTMKMETTMSTNHTSVYYCSPEKSDGLRVLISQEESERALSGQKQVTCQKLKGFI
jgi:hypothetical protein